MVPLVETSLGESMNWNPRVVAMASALARSVLVSLLLGVLSVNAFMAPTSFSGLRLRQQTAVPAFNRPPHAVARSASRTVPCVKSLAMKGPMHDAIDKVVNDNKIVLFMKGNQDFPQCGFSNTVCQILKACNANFEDINVLENELLRQGIKEYSQWPTIPQLYIDGEFIGGCDIAIDMYQSGELVELVERVMAEAD